MSFSVINAIAFYIFLEQTIARKEIKWRKIMFFRSRHLLYFKSSTLRLLGVEGKQFSSNSTNCCYFPPLISTDDKKTIKVVEQITSSWPQLTTHFYCTRGLKRHSIDFTHKVQLTHLMMSTTLCENSCILYSVALGSFSVFENK